MKLKVFICCIFLFLTLATLYANEPERIEKVVVTGIGIDADKARQNAIRNAVEQVIGTFVSSDTIVQNSQVLKDEILTYSGGYLKDSHTISEEKNDDGLFTIKLEAQVVSTKLKRKIESLNIATKKVEGDTLFGQAFSKVDQKQGGEKMIGNILSKYPQASYQLEVGKPSIENTDHRNEMASVNIPLLIRWDKDFLKELKLILAQTASKDFSSIGVSSFEKGSNRDIAESNQIVCFSTHATARSGRAEQCFALDKSLINEDYTSSEMRASGIRKKARKSNQSFSLLKLPSRPNSMSIYLVFKDAQGLDVITATHKFTSKDDYRYRQDEISPSAVSSFLKDFFGVDDSKASSKPKSKKTTRAKQPKSASREIDRLLEDGNEMAAFYPPGILWRDPNTNHLMLIEDAAFQMNIPVTVEIEKLKSVTKIEVSLESWAE